MKKIILGVCLLLAGCNTQHATYTAWSTVEGNIPASTYRVYVDETTGTPVVEVTTIKDTEIGKLRFARSDDALTFEVENLKSGVSQPVLANAEAIRAYIGQLEAAGEITDDVANALIQLLLGM